MSRALLCFAVPRFRFRATPRETASGPRRNGGLVCLLLTALWVPSVAGKDPVAAVPFALRTASGKVFKGRLQKIDDDWTVRLRSAKAKSVPGTEIISLRRLGVALPRYPRGEQVILANGGRLPGTLEKVADDRVHLRPGFPLRTEKEGPLRLPLSAVAVLWQAAPDGDSRPDLLLRKLARGRRARDLLLLRNGDRLEGTLLGMDRDNFRLETEGKKTVTVGRSRVAALAFNTELLSRARPRGVYAQLVLTTGCRLVLASARVIDNGRTLRGKLPTGGSVDLPLAKVVALDYRQGCAVYLSDLKQTSYKHTPYSLLKWPYVTDGSVADRDLRLGGSTYDKGLGMHSRSLLTYDLKKGYWRFEALVGLDADTGRRGRARVKVLLDGKSADIGWKKELTAKDGPRRISLDVRGKRQLTLVVDFGRFGDVQGHVNWADALLVKRETDE
jgi:hypothetical protein